MNIYYNYIQRSSSYGDKKSLKLPQLYSPLPTLVQFKKHILYKSQSMFIFNMGFYYLQTALRVLTQKERNYWMESQGLPVLALFWDPRSRRGPPLGVRTCVWIDQNTQPSKSKTSFKESRRYIFCDQKTAIGITFDALCKYKWNCKLRNRNYIWCTFEYTRVGF